MTIFVSILLIFICILGIYYFYAFMQRRSFFSKNDELKPQNNDIQSEISDEKIDILKILKFQSEYEFLTNSQNDNTLFIDFSHTLPRIFENKIYAVCEAVFDIINFYDSKFFKCEFTLKFKEISRTNDTIKLEISVSSNKAEKSLNNAVLNYIENDFNFVDTNLNSAKIAVSNLGSFLSFSHTQNSMELKFSLNLKFFQTESRNFKKYNFNVLIAQNLPQISNDLKAKFSVLGCDVRPVFEYKNVKRHIDDFIYKADICVISAEILKNKNEIEYLNSVSKPMFFVILLNNAKNLQILKELKFDFFRLDMPCFFDDIHAICELVSEKQELQN